MGLVSGLLGLLIWKATFYIHPLPPNNRKLDFYLQRIPAHAVFALVATIAYRLVVAKDEGHVRQEDPAQVLDRS